MHSIVTTFREAVIKVEVANFCAAMDTLIDQDGNIPACVYHIARTIRIVPQALIAHHAPSQGTYKIYLICSLDTSKHLKVDAIITKLVSTIQLPVLCNFQNSCQRNLEING